VSHFWIWVQPFSGLARARTRPKAVAGCRTYVEYRLTCLQLGDMQVHFAWYKRRN